MSSISSKTVIHISLILSVILITGLSSSDLRADSDAIFSSGMPEAAEVKRQILTAKDAAQGLRFGTAVALDGDTALVGATGGGGAYEKGAAYVFTRRNRRWVQTAKLTGDDRSDDSRFGYSVALDGDTALVGDPWENNHRGAVYVFTRSKSGWSRRAKWKCLKSTRGICYFGWSVALSGKTVVIGAPAADTRKGGTGNTGAAYIFTGSGRRWKRQATLIGRDSGKFHEFGSSVAVSGKMVVVGAPNVDEKGVAYLFRRRGIRWKQWAKLSHGTINKFAGFGDAVAIDGNTVLIGSPGYHVKGNWRRQGGVFVYTLQGRRKAILASGDSKSNSQFGIALDLDGDTALIGDRIGSSNAAYLFYSKNGRWSKGLKLTPYPRRFRQDFFGTSVALCKDTAIVGMPGADCDDGYSCGQAHAFTDVGPDNLKVSMDEPFIAGGVEGYMDQ